MEQHDSQRLTQPYLKSTDHLLPSGKRKIWGCGLLFTNTIRDALKEGGLWLVMQDSEGQSAMAEGDIVIRAIIGAVDWLSASQICVELNIVGWGNIAPSEKGTTNDRLSARLRPLWTDRQKIPAGDILIVRLKQWQLEYGHQQPWLFDHQANLSDPCWLCCRWLELLPLPLKTKLRLLSHPTPQACLRYLKKIIRQSDRYTEKLR